MKPMVCCRGLTRHYRRGGQTVAALDGIDLEVDDGEFVALMGPSGSGKSTLLNLIGGLDRPTAGEIEVAGLRLTRSAAGRSPPGEPQASASCSSSTTCCRCSTADATWSCRCS